jgi:cysteine desulfurase
VAAIAGLAQAAELVPARLAAAPRVGALRDRLAAALVARIADAKVHGGSTPRVPNTLSIAFPGLDAAALVLALDLAGLQVSRGSACRSGAEGPSPAIRALGVPESWARGTIRLSLGVETSEAEISEAVEILVQVIGRLRRPRRGGFGIAPAGDHPAAAPEADTGEPPAGPSPARSSQ